MTETNRYANQPANPPPPSAPTWRPVSLDKLKAFLGLCMAMGILRLPARSNYWRLGKWLLKTQFGFVMPRDQYDLIWRYMHLQNNEEPPPSPDRIWKLRKFLNSIVGNYQKAYAPDECVTVDESMVKFKGRLGFRQYLPSKPIKWGIKVWSMCESSTGYAYNLQVYTGRDGQQQEKGLAHRVVMDLCQPLLGKNMRLFIDNFYTSVPLLNDLLIRGVLACGTVRANRIGLPAHLKSNVVKLKKGEYRVAQKNDLVFTVWKDTKAVQFLSNFHEPDSLGVVRRRLEGKKVDVPVAKCVQDYQENMKGVDLMDQMIGYYLINHRLTKWWRRLFFYVSQVATFNAYIIANDQGYNKWNNFQCFLEDLVHELIGDYRADRAVPLPRTPLRAIQLHSCERLFRKRHVCRVCSESHGAGKRPGATDHGCKECQLPCHRKCFAIHVQRALHH